MVPPVAHTSVAPSKTQPEKYGSDFDAVVTHVGQMVSLEFRYAFGHKA